MELIKILFFVINVKMVILKIGKIKNVFQLKKIVNIKDVKLQWIKTHVIYVIIIINLISRIDYVLKEMLI